MFNKHPPRITVAFLFFAAASSFESAYADEKIDAKVSRIITQLKNKDPQLRLLAFMAIREEYGQRAQAAVPALIKLLRLDPPDADHLQVRKALASIGPAAAPAVRELLQTENVAWRERAAMALWHMSLGRRKPLSAVDDLIAATKDKAQAVRFWSIRALGEIGPKTNDVVPAIAGALRDEDAEVRRAAGAALAEFGPAARSATPLLIVLLRHDDVSTRAGAVFALGRIGPEARSATGELIQLLNDKLLREEAYVALARIGATRRHVPALIGVLRGDHTRSRQLAALNLAHLGADAEPALSVFTLALQEQPMRQFAIHALGQIGPGAKPAAPQIIKLLSSDSYFIRAGAAEALGRIGPGANAAIPALQAAANDADPLTRRHAKQALRKISPRIK